MDQPIFLVLALVNNEDQSLGFLMQAPVEAMCAVELSDREYLLVFASLGVYVDNRGWRTRNQEIMWPSIPNAVSEYFLSLSSLPSLFPSLLLSFLFYL